MAHHKRGRPKNRRAGCLFCKPCGMAAALDMPGVSLEGGHHRALDAARNIVKIASVIL